MNERPTRSTSLLHWPWGVMRFKCERCRRGRSPRIVKLALRYGPHATAEALEEAFRQACPHHPNPVKGPPQKYGDKCIGYVADIDSGKPPDLPGAAHLIRLIDGGKKDGGRKPKPADQDRAAG